MTDAPSWPPVTLRPRRVEVTRPGAPTLARHVVALPGAVLNCLFGQELCWPFTPAAAVISASKILCTQSSQPPRSSRAAPPRHSGSGRQRKADVVRQISHSRRPAPKPESTVGLAVELGGRHREAGGARVGMRACGGCRSAGFSEVLVVGVGGVVQQRSGIAVMRLIASRTGSAQGQETGGRRCRRRAVWTSRPGMGEDVAAQRRGGGPFEFGAGELSDGPAEVVGQDGPKSSCAQASRGGGTTVAAPASATCGFEPQVVPAALVGRSSGNGTSCWSLRPPW